MNQAFRRSLVAAAALAAAPTLADAQAGFPGGIRESGRHVMHAGRNGGPARAGEPVVAWMLGSGGEMSAGEHALSAVVGFSRDAKVAVEAVVGYARTQPDGTNTLSAALEIGIPLAPLAALGTRVAASGEGVWAAGSAAAYSAGVSVTQPLGARAELVGTAGYGVSHPGGGGQASAFVPSLSAALLLPHGSELRLEYRLDNGLDGEDSFQLLAVQLLQPGGAPPFQLRAGFAKHRVVSVGFLVFP